MGFIQQIAARTAVGIRKEERTSVRTPLELRRFGHARWEYRGVSTDVCPAGLGVDVGASLTVGEVVELRFLDSDSQTCHRVRVVYRNNQHHYGVKFLDGH
jgi:hypothetical protein